MHNIMDAVMSPAAEYQIVAWAVVGVVLVVVVPPVVKHLGVLVREYWAPKVARLRRKFGQTCRRISDRLGTEDEASAEVPPAEDVRRLPERV
ncbi:hypothetical protein OG625_40380 (plasmid) [Streptomyces sp. NBC_01351]|uniref:hypothetical protein n=1 Tax=Streptomyces sp. NBC_01351 TaxID=2903833 RepID=UPI002E335BF4|nr:hypothetical protein [Streptomyces sp. NBC_01351]